MKRLASLHWRIARAIGWLRFRGWSNGYWIYDLGHWLCDHDRTWLVFDGDEQTLCAECGAVLGFRIATTTTGSSSTVEIVRFTQ